MEDINVKKISSHNFSYMLIKKGQISKAELFINSSVFFSCIKVVPSN